jgi:hypothetical protein
MVKQVKKSIARQAYETAGEMIRAGIWTVDYAAYHWSEVTATVHPAYRAWISFNSQTWAGYKH